MVPRRRYTRVYPREYEHSTRYWGDFRDYADVGGSREPLIPEGKAYATTDPDLATEIAAKKVKAYEKARRRKNLTGIGQQRGLKWFAAHHLRAKARAGKVTEGWIDEVQSKLEVAVEFFGASTPLDAIGPTDIRRFLDHLTDKGLASGTRRHYLNAISNMYRRALSEEVALSNPAAAIMDKPTGKVGEARWMEHEEAAVFLEAARVVHAKSRLPKGQRAGVPQAIRQLQIPVYPLIATFLLTGARRSEVFGLDAIEDVSFDGKVVRIRPNEWRRVKTPGSRRTIPLWPQLARILADHLEETEYRSGLLFRSERSGRMITDARAALDLVTEEAIRLAGKLDVRFTFSIGEVRTRVFRHTYTAARLQTLDHGEPVSMYRVARELGHASTSTTERIYAHLGRVRRRGEVVEYRLGDEPVGAKIDGRGR